MPALGLAVAFVLVLTLVEAAGAAVRFPSGLAMQWCGTERAADVTPGWFPQERPQVKVVYAFANDQTGDFKEYSGLIQRDIKAALEMVGDASLGRRSIAFDLGTNCGPRYVDIASVPLELPSADYRAMQPTIGDRSAKIQTEVRAALGLGAGDTLGGHKRNFAVYVNIGANAGTARGDLPGCPKGTGDPLCQPDDRPGPENKANSGGYWAWVWGRLGMPGWPRHTPHGRLAMLHEITHNLGAVQDSAPHSNFDRNQPRGPNNPGAHCTDGRDVMCRGVAPDDDPPPPAPPLTCKEEVYDCGQDDYFNVNPGPGNHLATHWNVANSVFTCPYFSSPSERGCAPPGAGGDFNGDGFADLAVGVPDEDVGIVTNAGAVDVLSGTASGFSATGNQFWHQNQPGVPGNAVLDDRFGAALAAGDFNGDGFADLAVGVPADDGEFFSGTGAVSVLYGTASGLSSSAGKQLWEGALAHEGDRFGSPLAAGDFSGDGFADLAVGIPFRDFATTADAGAVQVFYGSASGLTTTHKQFWHQDNLGPLVHAEADDRFGSALAAGDFSGDGFADLAVGAPLEDLARENAGAVNVLYGSASRLTATGNQFWHQNRLNADGYETSDLFGAALAAGDFSGDGVADLAVGVPDEDVGTTANVGAVNVLSGTAAGLSATGNQFWHQDAPGVRDVEEGDDRFGFVLAAGDFNADMRADLAVGVPFEDVGTTANAGAVNVLYARTTGTAPGLSATGDQFWHLDVAGILNLAEPGDRFGAPLAVGDFNGDVRADVAVGVAWEDWLDVLDVGAVSVLFGAGTGLSPTGNQFWHQDNFGVGPDGPDVGEWFDRFGAALAP